MTEAPTETTCPDEAGQSGANRFLQPRPDETPESPSAITTVMPRAAIFLNSVSARGMYLGGNARASTEGNTVSVCWGRGDAQGSGGGGAIRHGSTSRRLQQTKNKNGRDGVKRIVPLAHHGGGETLGLAVGDRPHKLRVGVAQVAHRLLPLPPERKNDHKKAGRGRITKIDYKPRDTPKERNVRHGGSRTR